MPHKNATSDEIRQHIINDSEPVTESGCWIWMRSQTQTGYGFIAVGGKMRSAHRISYEVFVGEIPKGLCVMHKCDVPSCVNPSHLRAGTVLENIQDRTKKGRSARLCGEAGGNAKLNASVVREMRRRYSEGGVILKELADEAGVSITAVHRAVSGLTWGHII